MSASEIPKIEEIDDHNDLEVIAGKIIIRERGGGSFFIIK